MLVEGQYYRSVWWEGGRVKLIDQTRLPFLFDIYVCETHRDTGQAIKDMLVRGAPAIGVAAGYAMAQAVAENGGRRHLHETAAYLKSLRPTAYNLFYVVDRVLKVAEQAGDADLREAVGRESDRVAEEAVQACQEIGRFGEGLLPDGARVLTHCNAGWLACVDWGTALAPVYMAKRAGKKVSVLVSETRPRLQGMLTAWELEQEGVDYRIISDNAAGYYMRKGLVDLVITGADRIAANGDVANKIGTYMKAVLARENRVPFYVAAPLSTFDFAVPSGVDIPVEERDEAEVLCVSGLLDGRSETVRVAPEQSRAGNPAFDITPAGYVTGIVTEKGIIAATEAGIASVRTQR